MDRVVLQIPMNPKLKKNAEKRAENEGFSSLQEVVRIFLSKFADGRLEMGFQEQFPPVQLSQKAIKRYNKMDEDIKKGKNVFVAKSVDDLMDQLNGKKNPVPLKVPKKLQKKNFSKTSFSPRI